MSVQGYSASTVTVGQVSDSYIGRPTGSGTQTATPTIPAASFQASVSTGTSPTQYYTKSSSTALVLYMATAPCTSQSLMGVFWTDSSGVTHYCLDCTVSVGSLSSGYYPVTVTAPSTIPTGQTNFASVTAGTTQITACVSTQGTDVGNSSYVQNPDITDYSFPIASLQQLVLTCQTTGAFELFATPVGTLSDSADGVWVGSTTKTLTPSTAPGWVANALVGLAVTVNSTSVGTVVSNTTTQITTTINGSVSNGTYGWSIASPNLVLSWNYAYSGNFYNFVTSVNAAPYAGNVTKIRFYNATLTTQVMSAAGVLA